MVQFQCIAQEFPVKMSIDLGGGNAFVAEHFLYCPQVGPAFYKVCGKRMPECMRRDAFGDACLFGQVFNDHKDHNPAQSFASAVQKYQVFLIFLKVMMPKEEGIDETGGEGLARFTSASW